MKNSQEYMNTKMLAQKLNIPVNTIYYWVAKSQIPYIKIGKHHRFLYDEVMEFFKKKTLERLNNGEK